MKNKISFILIDKLKNERNFSELKTNFGGRAENSFDVTVLETTDELFSRMGNLVEVDCVVSIGNLLDFGKLNAMPFSVRRKWVHFDEYDPRKVVSAVIATFAANLRRENVPKTFSVFTCVKDTGEKKLKRLHESLKSQTYPEWNWFVLDDSDGDETAEILKSFEDPRITVFKNVSVRGNIGFNKRTIAMACDGDYLVEVDHDDELVPECFAELKSAFDAHPDAGFAYSSALELKGEKKIPIVYPNGWGHGEGLTSKQIVGGKEYVFSETPGINPFTIRTIYAQPNHVRCWRRETYLKIGGHSASLSVLDDMELIIRTFLKTRIVKIPKILYIQYEGEGERGVGKDNTQSVRFGEIQRVVWILKNRFDCEIHERILELGFEDTAWDEKTGRSDLSKKHEPGKEIMSYVV